MKNLQSIREARGMTKYRLTKLAGVAAGQLTNWERGTASPSLASAKRLAVALGTTIDELVGDLEEAPAS